MPYFMFGLGFLFATIIAIVAIFFFYFYTPDRPSTPLDRPTAQNGAPDVSVTLSQDYLNKELTGQLGGRTFQAGPAQLRDVVLRVLDNSQIEVTLRASLGSAAFDLTIVEQVQADANGKIHLQAAGQPKLVRGELPASVNTIINAANDQFIEPEINRSLSDVTVRGKKVQIVKISSRSGFLTVDANIR